MEIKTIAKLAGAAVGALVGLIFVFGGFEIIGPSERAVKVTNGVAEPQVYGPGLKFKAPIFTHFETVSAKPITQDVVIEVGPTGAVSSDNQTIGLAAKVAWSYDTARALELTQRYTDRDKLADLVNNTTYAAIKAEIGKYTIFDLAKNSGKIAKDAQVAAAALVKDYPVIIAQVNLTNWDWSDDFDAQIKATMNTQQRVAQAKAEADRVEQEQRAKAIEAEASAKALIATAEGEKQAAILRADGKKAEGQGINEYNRLIAQNQEIEIKFRQLEIDKIRAQRWNGKQQSDYIPLSPAGAVVTIPGN